MFKITGGKGFRIGFASGFSVSVQFGPTSHCDNDSLDMRMSYVEAGERGCANAEVAIIGPDGLIELLNGDTVAGYCSPDDVLHYINAAATSDPVAYLRQHLTTGA